MMNKSAEERKCYIYELYKYVYMGIDMIFWGEEMRAFCRSYDEGA